MAAADRIGPTLTSLTIRQDIVPSSTPGFSGVEVIAGAADAGGTGVDHVEVDFARAFVTSLGGTDSTTVTVAAGRAGSFLEGPQYSAYYSISDGGGFYAIADVKVVDKAGNVTLYTPDQLQSLGFATGVTVDGPGADTNPPALTGLTLPGTVTVAGGPVTANFGATAADDSSGPAVVRLDFDHGIVAYLQRQQDGSLATSQTYGTSTPSQTVTLQDAVVTDQAGNSMRYSATDLAAKGFSTSFQISNPAIVDTTAPVLNALVVPATIDISHGSTGLPITADVSESGTGVRDIVLTLSNDITFDYPFISTAHGGYYGGPILANVLDGQSSDIGFYGQSLGLAKSGDHYSFTFPDGRATPGVPLSALTSTGTYHVTGATVTDFAGNSATYTEAQLQALGANTVLSIQADGTAPSLVGLTLPGTVVVGDGLRYPQFSLTISDTGTGLGTAIVGFDQDVGIRPFGYPVPVNYIAFSGNGSEGITTTTISEEFSSYNYRGTYHVLDVLLTDGGGNQVYYSADQLKAMGIATSFMVGGSVHDDFNGDGHSDILFQNVSGEVNSWSATGRGVQDQVQQNSFDAAVDPSWKPVDTFDWNGDGRVDIVWRNTNGAFSVWTGQSSGFQQSAYNDTSVTASWHIVGAGDLDGDGNGDLVWRNDNGALSTWLSTGDGFKENAYFHAPVDTAWKVEGIGDFNGDGKADLLWRNDDGSVAVWNSTGAGFQESSIVHAPVDRSWHIVGIGDFDGDGKDDLLWHNDSGAVSVWLGSSSGFAEDRFDASVPQGWTVAEVGDFESDGHADILWRNVNGDVSIWQSTGSGAWQQNTYYSSVSTDWTVAGHSFVL